MKKLILLCLFSIVFVLLNCSEDKPTEPSNTAPTIQNISVSPSTIKVNETISLSCVATDVDGDELTYTWSANEGSFPNGSSGISVQWKAPDTASTYIITVIVNDGKETDEKEKNLIVSVDNSLIGIVYQKSTSVVLSDVLVEAGGKSVMTDNNGVYRIENIDAGEVTVKATKTDFEVFEQTVTMTPNQITELNIYLVGSIVISGIVIDKETQEPISDVKISIENKEVYTDVNGFYQLDSITQGTYSLSAMKENYFLFEEQIILSSGSVVIDIELEYTLSNLRGIVKDSYTNELLENIKISIDNKEYTTDANGYYEFLGLDKGTYTITANDEYYKYPIFIEQTTLINRDTVYNILLLNTCEGTTTVDYSGKTYNTVQIGEQCWLKENLDVGEMIISNTENDNQTDNGKIEKFCYDNIETNCDIYGGMYQWAEAVQYKDGASNTANPVFSGNVQGICPNGWHIPTEDELQILVDAVGGSSNSLKAIGVGFGDGAGINTSGFSALLAGHRLFSGSFLFLDIGNGFWSTFGSGVGATFLTFGDGNNRTAFSASYKKYGFSIRCLKD